MKSSFNKGIPEVCIFQTICYFSRSFVCLFSFYEKHYCDQCEITLFVVFMVFFFIISIQEIKIPTINDFCLTLLSSWESAAVHGF